MKFKQSRKVLFLDPLFDGEIEYEKKEKVSLVLSPSLYWVKKIKLPVTSLREVKKLLPSIFEDTLPEGNYSYTAYKIDDEFMVFAYEDKKILDLLVQKGLSISSVGSIHFAQSEFDTLETALKINEEEVMYLKEDVLVLTPLTWVKSYKTLELDDFQLSKHKITLQQFGHIVDNKSLYKIGIVALVFIVILLAEIFITTQKSEAVLMAKDEVFSKYKLPSTMLQNRSTKKKYNSIYKHQTKLRTYISYILSLKLKNKQKIALIDFKNKTLSVSFENVQKIDQKVVLSQLDAKKVKYTSSFKNENLKVEIKL